MTRYRPAAEIAALIADYMRGDLDDGSFSPLRVTNGVLWVKDEPFLLRRGKRIYINRDVQPHYVAKALGAQGYNGIRISVSADEIQRMAQRPKRPEWVNEFEEPDNTPITLKRD